MEKTAGKMLIINAISLAIMVGFIGFLFVVAFLWIWEDWQ
jgi:hypothetical protein